MSPRHAFCLIAVSMVLVVEAFVLGPSMGSWSLILLYPAASFLLLGIAYCGAGVRLLAKRLDGCLPWTTMLPFGPYLLLNQFAWRLLRRLSNEPTTAQAAPNLFFGRRLATSEVHVVESLGLSGCLDLTSEFSETYALRRLPRYRCLPLLDATAPTIEQLRDAVHWLREATTNGPIYVHCALGHGRTGTIVIACLLAIGKASTIDDGLAQLQHSRPGVDINRRQRVVLQQFLAEHRSSQGTIAAF